MQAGLDAGTFTARDARATARALFHATCRFHKPVHAGSGTSRGSRTTWRTSSTW
ncbi:hypothetical protein [Streptomyces sp. NPDC003730]